MKKIYDISVSLSKDTPNWPTAGNSYICKKVKSIKNGDLSNVSRIELSVHSGTHIDAPYHHLENGGKIEDIGLERFIVSACVIDLTRLNTSIGIKDFLNFKWEPGIAVLLKTKNSNYWNSSDFREDYVYLESEACQYLVDQQVTCVGIDYLSIEQFGVKKYSSHHILLNAGTIIIEGLDLLEVPEGYYQLFCLPIKIKDVEASPCRAILVR